MYFRCEGTLGSYSVWHERLTRTLGPGGERPHRPFRLGLVPFSEQTAPHSVMIQQLTEFTVYLPPRRLRATSSAR